MANNEISKQISDYSEIFPLIWSALDVRAGQKALDIGIGSKAISTRNMIDKKLNVIGIDIDPNCRAYSHDQEFTMHLCDVCFLPYKNNSYDFSLAFFSMHEVDSKKHKDALSEMKRVSKKVAIIEPLPNTDEIGIMHNRIWREAMNSVGKFEIYQPLNYWFSIMARSGFTKISHFQLKVTKKVTKANTNNFCEQSITHFKKIGVKNKYILEMKDLKGKIERYGMEHSDIAIIIGNVK